MRRPLYFLFVAILALIAAGSGTRAERTGVEHHILKVALTGGAEVPGPGDTDGTGNATLTFNHEKGELCYELSVKDIQEATATHIHAGAAGAAGDVKVTLKAPVGGSSKACVSVDKALLKEINDKPGNFYINVHNAEFPKGAVRGQLGK